MRINCRAHTSADRERIERVQQIGEERRKVGEDEGGGGEREVRYDQADIRCRRITDLAGCHAAFQGTSSRFQNLFPPAL
jgi:hypothetical protein